jgi:hypothetical protein
MKDNKHIDIDLDFLSDKPKSNHVNTSQASESQKNDNENNHINTNLDFLNEESNNKNAIPAENRGKKYNWIKIFWITVAILFFIGWISSDSGSTSYSPPSSSSNTYSNTGTTNSTGQDDLVITGEFMCSQYHNSKATQLEPTNESQLELERSALSRRSASIDSMLYEIENSTVTEYSSQWEIDEYNQSLEDYDSMIEQYNLDSNRFDAKVDNYNRAVEIYNNYLTTNCDPR